MTTFKKNPLVEDQIRRSVEMERALRAQAEAAAAAAREMAPVDSGDYRDGIKADSDRDPIARAAVVATDFKSHWIEFGTIRQPARAILRRACEAVGLTTIGGRDDA
jgi:hypothetical protein